MYLDGGATHVELGWAGPPVRIGDGEVLGQLALDDAGVNGFEGVVEDTLDLLGVRAERGDEVRVGDKRNNG